MNASHSIRSNLPAECLCVFDAVTEALQGAEEIYGPGEEHYAALMLAVIAEAKDRLRGFAENMEAQRETAYRDGDDEEGQRLHALAVDARAAL